jgi:hypothetical protein
MQCIKCGETGRTKADSGGCAGQSVENRGVGDKRSNDKVEVECREEEDLKNVALDREDWIPEDWWLGS